MRQASPDVDVDLALSRLLHSDEAEHQNFTQFDLTGEGWDRDIAARIEIYDMATGTVLIRDACTGEQRIPIHLLRSTTRVSVREIDGYRALWDSP